MTYSGAKKRTGRVRWLKEGSTQQVMPVQARGQVQTWRAQWHLKMSTFGRSARELARTDRGIEIKLYCVFVATLSA
jgi:hypothetical protein